ncbi:MAG: hypothetical protein NVSMB7_13150 [Chitinophagaceae bacterium]
MFLCSTIAASAQDSTQAQLLGRYKFPDGSVVTEVAVTFENGALTMSSSAGVSALEPLKGDSFNIVSFNGTAVFKRNDAKKITGVHIEASGYVLDGVKDIATTGSVAVNTTMMLLQLKMEAPKYTKGTGRVFIERWRHAGI